MLLDRDRSLFDWASKQTYIALANMMSTAALLRIDSCPIEGFQKEKVEALLVDKGKLNPEEFGVSVMVAFGYRNETQSNKTRQGREEVIQIV